MSKDRGTIGQAARILDAIIEIEPTTEQVQGVIENVSLLQMLFKFGPQLRGINRYSLEGFLIEALKGPLDFITPKSVESQLAGIKELYPEFFDSLDSSNVSKIVEGFGDLKPDEDFFLIVPKLSAIASRLGFNEPYETYSMEYGKCVAYMIGRIVSLLSPPFSCITGGHFQLHESWWVKNLEMETEGDFIIFPMHSGKLWRGYDAWEASEKMLDKKQTPFTSWMVGHYLFACREDLDSYEAPIFEVACLADRSCIFDSRHWNAPCFSCSCRTIDFSNTVHCNSSTEVGFATRFTRKPQISKSS